MFQVKHFLTSDDIQEQKGKQSSFVSLVSLLMFNSVLLFQGRAWCSLSFLIWILTQPNANKDLSSDEKSKKFKKVRNLLFFLF